MDAIVTPEEFVDLFIKVKKEHRPKLAQVEKERSIREMLPEREYLIALDLQKLGIANDPYIMLKWIEWGVIPEFTSVRPIMALYKTSKVIEFLEYIELQKKIDQQVMDEKPENL